MGKDSVVNLIAVFASMFIAHPGVNRINETAGSKLFAGLTKGK
jgi:hypothetical protein